MVGDDVEDLVELGQADPLDSPRSMDRDQEPEQEDHADDPLKVFHFPNSEFTPPREGAPAGDFTYYGMGDIDEAFRPDTGDVIAARQRALHNFSEDQLREARALYHDNASAFRKVAERLDYVQGVESMKRYHMQMPLLLRGLVDMLAETNLVKRVSTLLFTMDIVIGSSVDAGSYALSELDTLFSALLTKLNFRGLQENMKIKGLIFHLCARIACVRRREQPDPVGMQPAMEFVREHILAAPVPRISKAVIEPLLRCDARRTKLEAELQEVESQRSVDNLLDASDREIKELNLRRHTVLRDLLDLDAQVQQLERLGDEVLEYTMLSVRSLLLAFKPEIHAGRNDRGEFMPGKLLISEQLHSAVLDYLMSIVTDGSQDAAFADAASLALGAITAVETSISLSSAWIPTERTVLARLEEMQDESAGIAAAALRRRRFGSITAAVGSQKLSASQMPARNSSRSSSAGRLELCSLFFFCQHIHISLSPLSLSCSLFSLSSKCGERDLRARDPSARWNESRCRSCGGGAMQWRTTAPISARRGVCVACQYDYGLHYSRV